MAIPRVVPVFTADIKTFWPTISPFVEKALVHSFGTWSQQAVHDELSSGDAQAFLIFDGTVIGCFITTVITFPNRKALHVPIVAGSRMDEWLSDMHAMTQRFAKVMGCNVVTGSGRRGWVTKLKALGWQEELVNISVEVT